ncbi:hypothetical protein Tco_0718408 [Tanacetum coccineum]
MPSPSVSTFTFPSTTEPVFSASTSEPVFESPNHTQTSQTTQSQQLQQYHTTTVSNNNAKFPYLKKEEYETWAMKMEYWIMNKQFVVLIERTKRKNYIASSFLSWENDEFNNKDVARFDKRRSNAIMLRVGSTLYGNVQRKHLVLKQDHEGEDVGNWLLLMYLG